MQNKCLLNKLLHTQTLGTYKIIVTLSPYSFPFPLKDGMGQDLSIQKCIHSSVGCVRLRRQSQNMLFLWDVALVPRTIWHSHDRACRAALSYLLFPPLVPFFFFHDKMSLSTFQSPAALLKINFIVETGSCDGVHLWSAQGCVCGGEMQLFLAPQDKQWEQWLCLLGKQYIFTFIQRHSVGWWWPCSCLRLSPAGEQMCRLIPSLWTQNF